MFRVRSTVLLDARVVVTWAIRTDVPRQIRGQGV